MYLTSKWKAKISMKNDNIKMESSTIKMSTREVAN
jgi:hypothetical protein